MFGEDNFSALGSWTNEPNLTVENMLSRVEHRARLTDPLLVDEHVSCTFFSQWGLFIGSAVSSHIAESQRTANVRVAASTPLPLRTLDGLHKQAILNLPQ